MMRMDGKTVIITGGASGLGAAIAEAMAKNGANLALLDINAEGLAKVKNQVSQYSTRVETYKVDVTDYKEVQKIGEIIYSDFDKVDVLVNCAGGGKEIVLGFRELTEESWKRQIDLNLNSTFNCCKMVIENMIAQKSGKIINISSVAGLRGGGLLGRGAYSTAKAGVVGLTKALAKELGPFNVHAIAVAPGYHVTPLTENIAEDKKNAIMQQIPLNKAGDPKKLGELIVFLASDDAQFITGSLITVDGGYSMH
ncbi:MAG: SDR family oxidoreductase [Firmicutes bacterium]|nr:SDR family oxidoreductase [Bacillota bacterium]